MALRRVVHTRRSHTPHLKLLLARIDRHLERAHARLELRTLVLELCDLGVAAHHFEQALLGKLLGALGLAQPLVAHLGRQRPSESIRVHQSQSESIRVNQSPSEAIDETHLAQPLVAHLALPIRQLILEMLALQVQLRSLLGDTHLEELTLHRRSACRHLQLLLLGTRERRVPLQCRHLCVQARRSALRVNRSQSEAIDETHLCVQARRSALRVNQSQSEAIDETHLCVQARRSALGSMQLLTDRFGGRTRRHERLRLRLDLGALVLRLLDGAHNLEISLARVRDERLMREAITCHQRPSGGALRGALRGTQRH